MIYDEVRNLKKDTSKLLDQIKLNDSLIEIYESLTVVFNQPSEMPTLTIANSKVPCLEGPITGCWKEVLSKAQEIQLQFIRIIKILVLELQKQQLRFKPNEIIRPTNKLIFQKESLHYWATTVEQAS